MIQQLHSWVFIQRKKKKQNKTLVRKNRDFSGGPGAKKCTPNAGGPGSVLSHWSHMLQLRVCLRAAIL